MIVRIFQVTTQPGKAEEFAEFFHGTAIPLMKKQKGLETLIPCAPHPETPEEFAMVMIWRDMDAMKAPIVGINPTTNTITARSGANSNPT